MPSSFLRMFYLAGCLLLLNPGLMAQLPRLALPIGHAGGSKIVGISGDDRILITSTDSQTFLWDLETGVQLRSYPIAYSSIVPYLPKSTGTIEDDVLQLHFEEREQKAKFVDLKNGKEIDSYYKDRGCDFFLKNSKSNRIVELSNRSKTVTLLSTDMPFFREVLPGHTSVIVRVSFSDDGTRIFTESLTEILIWDSKNGDLIGRIENSSSTKLEGYNSDITKIITSSPSKVKYSYKNQWTYKIWDVVSQCYVKSWNADQIDISKDRSTVATLLNREQVSVISLSSGEVVSNFNIDKDTHKILFSHDRKRIFTAARHKVKCWQSNNGALLHTVDRSIWDMILNKAGDNLISMSFYPQGTQVFNLDRNEIIRDFTYKLNQKIAPSYFVNSDDSGVVFSNLSSIKRLNISKDEIKLNIKNFGDTGNFKISPKQNWFVTSGVRNGKMWNLNTNELHQKLNKLTNVSNISFSVDEKLFAINNSYSRKIKIYDSFSKRVIKVIKKTSAYSASLSFDLSSTKLLVADIGCEYIQVFNLLDGKLLFFRKYNKADWLWLLSTKFSNDGKHLFFPLDKNRVGVYSFESKELKPYFNYGGGI